MIGSQGKALDNADFCAAIFDRRISGIETLGVVKVDGDFWASGNEVAIKKPNAKSRRAKWNEPKQPGSACPTDFCFGQIGRRRGLCWFIHSHSFHRENPKSNDGRR